MFDSLDEQIKKDIESQTPRKQRMLIYLLVAVASVLLFGGLWYGVRLIE